MKHGMAAGGDVLEVVLTWGGDGGGCVLATKYLAPGDVFAVGEGDSADALVPDLAIGGAPVDLITCDAAGAVAWPPPGASVWIDGVPAPAERVEIARGQALEMVMGAFVLRARTVESETHAAAFAPSVDASDWGGIALSSLGHVACLAALALFLPGLGADDEAEISRDQLLTMQHLLSASAEREQEAQEADDEKPADVAEDHGASGGGRALGKAGAMGTTQAPPVAGHWSAKGDEARELQSLSHEEKQALVKDFGMLGLIATMSDPNAPTVPWGETLRGADRESHLGGLFGPDAADTWGIGGLSVSGPYEGGGGFNRGLGANDVGDLSASLDRRLGHDDPGGWGHGTCVNGPCKQRAHQTGAFLRMPREITTNGRLPKEVIQRIIRQNQGRYRACYESGLRTNPGLEGRVEVRFMIDRQGQVSLAQDGASDLPSDGVRSCIVKSFYSLSFPSPEGGTVSVVYPMVLTPAD